MKTKLLSLLTVVFFTGIAIGQTKVWDFGNDQTTWPESAGIGNTPMVVDHLGLYPVIDGNTNFGAITANNSTFSDGYTSTHRFQMNGGGSPDDAAPYMPTQRYLYMDVDSDCTIKIWFRPGSNGSQRTVVVTDGTSLVGSGTSNDGDDDLTDYVIFTANYTSATGGRLYIYGDGTANNLYKIEVNGANVTTEDAAGLASDVFSTAKVYTNSNQLFVSGLKTNTQVDVYSMTGALVKSAQTTSDTSFQLNSTGVYIVKLTSNEGQKSVKVLVN